MLPRHTLETIRTGYLVITNPAQPDIQNQSVVSFSGDDTFLFHHTKNDVSYRPKDEFLICLPFNVGYVPFKCTLTVESVERRIITGVISITMSESELYEIPCIQRIQLDVSQSISGEDYKKITTINSSFDALYPFKIAKKISIVEEKVYPNFGVEAKYKRMVRKNQVWVIPKNEWKTVPKPYPRNQAWEWHDDTCWVCLKNEETGDLMPLDRAGMPNCWPPRVPNPAVPSNPLDTPNPSNPIDEND